MAGVKRGFVAGLLTIFLAAQIATSTVAGTFGERSLNHQKREVGLVSTSLSIFEFHSDFWFNLHHLLYWQSLPHTSAGPGSGDQQAGAVSYSAHPIPEQLNWERSVDFYRTTFAKRELLSDRELVTDNYTLADLDNAPAITKSELPQALVDVLVSAAPYYRANLWNTDDARNRAWIKDVDPLIQKYGAGIRQELEKYYRGRWAEVPLRVEVTNYTDRKGAYTTLNSTLITISSSSGPNQGPGALEALFHEASHALLGPHFGAISEELVRECSAKKKPVPNGFWHALLFYTTGEVVRRALARDGLSYTPSAYRNGVYERGQGWREYQRLLERDWQPYIESKVSLEQAVAALVSDFPG